MKRFFLYSILFSVLLTLASCEKEPLSPTDPLPFPSDGNKDLSIHPGDNFFRYCNGTWLDKAIIPDGNKITGGLYTAGYRIRDQKALMLETDPLLADVMASAKAPDAREKNKAYIEKLLALVPDPKDPAVTQEDYARLTGKLYRMGVDGLLSLLADKKDGVIAPFILPDVYTLISPDDLPDPEPGAPKTRRFMDLLCEALEIPKDLVILLPYTLERDEYAICLTMDKEMIAEALRNAIRRMDMEMEIDAITEKVADAAIIYTEYVYTKQNVPSGLKEKYTAVAERLRAQYRKRIEALDWMSDATKAKALEKLDAMNVCVAYPDDWREHLLPTLEKTKACGSFLEKYMYIVSCCDRVYYMDLFGKKDKDHVFDLKIAGGYKISNVGGQYNTQTNSIFICSGTLLPPIMPDDVTEAYTYAVFSIIGHEMTHGFDSDGARFDKDGNDSNWWTVADQMTFEDRLLQLVDCYNHLELAPDILPGKYCDGSHTLEENIADLGGLSIALDAYTEYLQEQGYSGEGLKAQQRKFFESYADVWCCKYGEEFIKGRTEGKSPIRTPSRRSGSTASS